MKNILKMNIGIIGCGTMGLPMIKILSKQGINITGHDIRDKANFKTVKNRYIEDKFSFFNQNDIILSAVRDIKQTIEICEGKNGLFYFKEKKILLILSTLSFFKQIEKKAPKNISLIDSLMSGAPMSAKKGSHFYD